MTGSKGVMRDGEVAGGEGRRAVDHALSEALGGYRSGRGGDTVYGRYVEPVLHAAEHGGRAAAYGNAAEWARAKDELGCVGRGLEHMREPGCKPDQDALALERAKRGK